MEDHLNEACAVSGGEAAIRGHPKGREEGQQNVMMEGCLSETVKLATTGDATPRWGQKERKDEATALSLKMTKVWEKMLLLPEMVRRSGSTRGSKADARLTSLPSPNSPLPI